MEDSISGLVKNSDDIPNSIITLKDNVSAPISKGTILGSITYKIGNNSYTKNIVASHDVEQDAFLLLIFKCIFGFAVFLILITIILSKSKKKRKKKKYRYRGI